jgi:hypothetical protein
VMDIKWLQYPAMAVTLSEDDPNMADRETGFPVFRVIGKLLLKELYADQYAAVIKYTSSSLISSLGPMRLYIHIIQLSFCAFDNRHSYSIHQGQYHSAPVTSLSAVSVSLWKRDCY